MLSTTAFEDGKDAGGTAPLPGAELLSAIAPGAALRWPPAIHSCPFGAFTVPSSNGQTPGNPLGVVIEMPRRPTGTPARTTHRWASALGLSQNAQTADLKFKLQPSVHTRKSDGRPPHRSLIRTAAV